MTPADEGFAAAKRENEENDEKNVNYLFQTTHTELLIQLLKEKTDIKYYVKKELAWRGLNADGLWVGFKTAEKELQICN